MRFRLDFQDPPAASSGTKYKTVDARCAACEIKGGHEKACLPERILEIIRRDRQQACPRVELDAENDDAAAVLGFLVNGDLVPLAPQMFEALMVDQGGTDRAVVLARIASAMRDREVYAVLHPKPPAKG